MGFRFRQSIGLLPGLKLNFNKDSVSVTAGIKGAHFTVNSNGATTTSFGIPGTGLSYVQKSATKTKRKGATYGIPNKFLGGK